MKLLRAWTTLTSLTFRRLLWSASTMMVLLPLTGCLLFILWRFHNRPDLATRDFRDFSEFLILIFASIVVPICALAFGTASVGGDREDRTLVFLLVRPIPRALVLLAKFTATLPLVLGLVVGSYWLYCRLAGEVGQVAFGLYLPALIYMTLAYVCLFHLFAVAFRHSTIIALIYALFMELLLGNIPGIAKRVAVNYYGRSIMYAAGANEGLPTPDPRWFEPLSVDAASWALVGIAFGGLLLALVIFSRREYRDLT
ncbi:MAG: ABC transporter permease subunit [Planctomycetia bacterium]|nr:ABC transporter permease subunit [Planctomycetia bacterium]